MIVTVDFSDIVTVVFLVILVIVGIRWVIKEADKNEKDGNK